MSDIRECPFCGNNDVAICTTRSHGTYKNADGEMEDIIYYYILCRDCYFETGSYYSEEIIESRWNRRAEQQGWISVNERLPDDGVDVIVIADSRNIGFAWHDYRGWYDSNHGWIKISKITHWHPLPEPPQAQKEDRG